MIRPETRALKPERSALKPERRTLQPEPWIGVSIQAFTDGCYRLHEAIAKAGPAIKEWGEAYERARTGPR